MKFLALSLIFLSAMSNASVPMNLCLEEYMRTGNELAFEICMKHATGSTSTQYSVSANECSKFFQIGTPAYNDCIHDGFDKFEVDAAIEMVDLYEACKEEFGLGTPDYDNCIRQEMF